MPAPDFLDLPARTTKPRRTGITHVLDAGLPVSEAAGLLEAGGKYVDVWKFGWGVAYLDPGLEAKLELGHAPAELPDVHVLPARFEQSRGLADRQARVEDVGDAG